MDALNVNFPVGQPDLYGNYEWMQIKSGNGVSSTGNVIVNEGDLFLNGGNILNADVEDLGQPTNFWSITTPLEMSVYTSVPFTPVGAFPAQYNWTQCSPEPDPAPGPPYASVNNQNSFTINEPGLYQIEMGIGCLVGGNLTQNRAVAMLLHDGTDYLTGTERARVILHTTDVVSLALRYAIAYLKVPTGGQLYGITWLNDYAAPVPNISIFGGPQNDNERRGTFVHVKKISDDVQASVPIP